MSHTTVTTSFCFFLSNTCTANSTDTNTTSLESIHIDVRIHVLAKVSMLRLRLIVHNNSPPLGGGPL